MMTETVQRGIAKNPMPDFVTLKNIMENDGKGQIREHEITKFREYHLQEEKRRPGLRKSRFQGPRGRQWSRPIDLGEIHRPPSLFTWRC